MNGRNFFINRLQDDVRREVKKTSTFYRYYFNKVLAEQTASLDKTIRQEQT
jgi:hypothetical protein